MSIAEWLVIGVVLIAAVVVLFVSAVVISSAGNRISERRSGE